MQLSLRIFSSDSHSKWFPYLIKAPTAGLDTLPSASHHSVHLLQFLFCYILVWTEPDKQTHKYRAKMTTTLLSDPRQPRLSEPSTDLQYSSVKQHVDGKSHVPRNGCPQFVMNTSVDLIFLFFFCLRGLTSVSPCSVSGPILNLVATIRWRRRLRSKEEEDEDGRRRSPRAISPSMLMWILRRERHDKGLD